MISTNSILGVVIARGGSKQVPHKNLRELGGKPLLAWTLEAADQSIYLDRTVVSSEDAEIRRVAKEWGGDVPFARPEELAADDTPSVVPVLHALTQLPGYDYVVLLQPTSPFRTSEDIDACIERCAAGGAPSCVSVTPTTEHPHWVYRITERGTLRPLLEVEDRAKPRQQLPQLFVLNGAVSVARTAWLERTTTFLGEETLAQPMPWERGLDIDTEIDFLVAEALASHRGLGQK